MSFAAKGQVYDHALRISKRPRRNTDILSPLVLSGAGIGSLGKGKVSGPSTAVASTSTSSPGQQSPEDSDGTIEQARAGSEITTKHTKMCDVVGIKIFTVGVLGIRL